MNQKQKQKKNKPASLSDFQYRNIELFKLQALTEIQNIKYNHSITNQHIAEKSGLHFQTIRNTLAGKTTNLETLIKILTVLDIEFHLNIPRDNGENA
jgi:predicted transcriptional regulator